MANKFMKYARTAFLPIMMLGAASCDTKGDPKPVEQSIESGTKLGPIDIKANILTAADRIEIVVTPGTATTPADTVVDFYNMATTTSFHVLARTNEANEKKNSILKSTGNSNAQEIIESVGQSTVEADSYILKLKEGQTSFQMSNPKGMFTSATNNKDVYTGLDFAKLFYNSCTVRGVKKPEDAIAVFSKILQFKDGKPVEITNVYSAKAGQNSARIDGNDYKYSSQALGL